jgi:hypothetical protein
MIIYWIRFMMKIERRKKREITMRSTRKQSVVTKSPIVFS